MSEENAIVEFLETPDRMLKRLRKPEDVKSFLSELTTLEKLLKLADVFNQKARKYAELEAATYKRIVDLGLIMSVPHTGNKFKIVSWFASLKEEKQNEVIDECGKEGMTIQAIWKRDVQQPAKEMSALRRMMDVADEAYCEFKDEGVVELEPYFDKMDSVGKLLRQDVRKGCKDKLREKIRDAGGHGLGDGSGTYLSKTNASHSAKEIIDNKILSIIGDMRRLIEFMEDDDTDVVFDIRTVSNFTDEFSIESAIYMALLVLGCGRPDLHTEDPVKKIRLYTNVLWNIFRITPYEFFHEIMRLSSISYYGVHLQSYGWPLEDNGDE